MHPKNNENNPPVTIDLIEVQGVQQHFDLGGHFGRWLLGLHIGSRLGLGLLLLLLLVHIRFVQLQVFK